MSTRATPDYPDDADGDALRRVASDGSDMTRPMEIDFEVLVPDLEAGRAIAAAAAALGYATSLSDEPSQLPTCTCTRTMIPAYEAMIEAQAQLDALARPLGGRSDGWGTFGNGPSSR